MAEGGNSPPATLAQNCEENKHNQTSRMDAIDILLERTKNERLQELQQIQNENRPVTGSRNGEQINRFFSKNLEAQEHVHAAHATGKENVPLNSPNVEEHRPEAVCIEIQGLSQQGRVSNVLQTSAFRRQLESIIRGSISSVARTRSPVTSVAQSPASSHQPSPSPAQRLSPVREQTTSVVPMPPGILSASVLSAVPGIRQERADSVSSRSSLGSASTTSSSNVSVDYTRRIHDPRGLLGSVLNNTAPAPPAPQAPAVPVAGDNGNIEVGWHTVEEMQQEDLVQEISELVHRRLVSTTLEGDFRNVLEFHIRDRVQATGTDGRRVAEFVRSIPQTEPHLQNDFSNMGIPAPVDNWDNISVTSVSATHVPYTQTNLHMSRELTSLKAQMQEMRNMMKVSFELQLDIQRAIRQEVAAGIAAATGGQALGSTQANNTGTAPTQPGNAAQTANTPRSRPVNDTHCLICLDNHSDCVLYQCGHMCVCYPCGRHLMDRQAKCPVCRAPIRDVIRAYKCNQD